MFWSDLERQTLKAGYTAEMAVAWIDHHGGCRRGRGEIHPAGIFLALALRDASLRPPAHTSQASQYPGTLSIRAR